MFTKLNLSSFRFNCLHIFQYASFTYHFFRIYLYIFQCAILGNLTYGGGKESRTPDLLLARQAL